MATMSRFGDNEDDDQRRIRELFEQTAAPGQSTTMPVGPPSPLQAAQPLGPPPAQPTGPTKLDRDQLRYGSTGSMSGFRQDDYGGDVKARNTVKNTFGRIASRYKNAPSSVDSLLADPDFQRYFPSAKKVEGGARDKIDFGGVLSDFESGTPVGVVDVLQSSDPNADTAANWVWLPDEGGMGPEPPGGGDPALWQIMGGATESASADALGQSDVLAQILKALQQQGTGDPRAQDLLQSLMRG